MTQLKEMKVGESYEELVRYEGFVAGYTQENGLVLILTDLFADEDKRKLFQQAQPELKLLRKDHLILFLVKLGTLNWLEAPYGICRELVDSGCLTLAPELPARGVPYTFLIGDGASGELLVKREGLLSPATCKKFQELLREMDWDHLPGAEENSKAYTELGKNFTTEQLAQKAGRAYKLKTLSC